MAYIGRQNLGGAYRQLDDISSGFDGSDTTHTMQVNSVNVTVGDVNQIILSLGGVIQKPGTDFTVSGSVLTFTTAPAANTSFFAVLLGSDNGGTVTPTDGSVTSAKLAYPFVVNEDGAAASDFRVESDSNTHMLFVDAGNDKIGINTSSPAKPFHISSADNQPLRVESTDAYSGVELKDNGASTLPPLISGLSDGFKIYAGHGSSRPEVMAIDSTGAVTKPLQPAFLAVNSVTQTDIANSDTVSFTS